MSTQGELARARAQAEVDGRVLRHRAARVVASRAVDAQDRHSLLSMLGLDDSDGGAPLRNGLAGYVRAVAAAVSVPPEATGFEVSDTVTAYLGLTVRWALRPSRDLMLVWTELHGWSVAVETSPGEHSIVVGYLGGEDLVPGPYVVARFVSGVVGGLRASVTCPAYPVDDDREELARRLSGYASKPGNR